MDISADLLNAADDLAFDANARADRLKADLKEIEARKLAIDAELERAQGAAKRRLNFQPRIGTKYQCPRCWVLRSVNSSLSAIKRPPDHDVLRCDTCGAEWPIPTDR